MYQEFHSEQQDYFHTQVTLEYHFRKESLQKLLQELTDNKDAILEALHQDFQKPYFEGFMTEYVVVIKELKDTIRDLKKWMAPERKGLNLPSFPSRERIYKEPFGQVLVIAPWNYPFALAMSPLITAIAAGNCVVLKPSELSSHTDTLLANIIKKVFDPLHVTSFSGDAKVAQSLLALRWDYIFFTGSVPVGKIIAKEAAKNLTPVTLELGGKNPTIVDKDIDIKVAAKRIIWGKFINAGQTCIAPDYLIIHESIYDTFIQELKQQIRQSYGDDIKTNKEYARIINENNFNRLIKMLDGERFIAGGEHDISQCYIAPTLIEKPTLESEVMKDEIFGPILPLLTFKTQEDIENILFRYEKPLALYTFSNNKNFVKKQLSRFSFGGGCVNDVIMQFTNDRLPFGGVGHSGMGAYHGKRSFDIFSHHKAISHRIFAFDLPIRQAPYTKLKWKLVQKIFGIK
jgi:aldehyde dehydrogenase (NAD+)